ncbi:65-kDa microtubule-associated protein 3 [Olea europaea subsp. europaea]|uniref:65-kDa microtubule-associated protein 3 n=1 Tax=Olea europaea subsp. europaea TaxID=158383 RepID=A0A8S0VFJ0_OLEEU|nr:65-kDa microtubule-associated protein 3 [Olea europaea subsp. europaea]
MFQNVTKNIAASEAEIIEPNILSLDFINHAEAEVLRLQEMKSSKMKEVLLKKRSVLEDICRASHIVVGEQNSIDFSIETIECGTIDPLYLLEQLEIHISKVKEEAFSRKDIVEKVEKWLAACEEECWLEEYNRDDNRYNAGRGTHLMLKRAEKVRALISKIPGMVETLKSKLKAWEKERGFEFLYDGVGLVSMLEKYHVLKLQKEQERQRPSTGGVTDKRLSLGGAVLRNAYAKKAGLSSHSHMNQQTSRSHNQSGFSNHSSVKNNISGGNSSNLQSMLIRKPLSPLSPNVDPANIQDQNVTSAELQDMQNVYKTPVVSPKKNVSNFNESRTPKTMPIAALETPPTASIKMQTVMTPATPFCTEDVEYSFEERRAGFISPKLHSFDSENSLSYLLNQVEVTMESREGISGVRIILPEAPSSYHVAPRTENSTLVIGIQPMMTPSVASAGLLATSEKKKRGEWVSCSTGGSFLPHLITVDTGEDVSNRIMSFSLEGPRAICIILAVGLISSVTLRQPNSSGNTLTYKVGPE